MTPVAVTAQPVRRIPPGAQRYGGAQLPPPHVGAPFMTPVAVTAQAVRRIPRGAQRYGGAQLPPQHVGAPFMTPGAGTAQAVRRIPRGTGWLTAVVSDETGRQTGNPGRLTEILKSLTELTGRLTGKTISQPRQTGSRFRSSDS